jgi:ferredoxin
MRVIVDLAQCESNGLCVGAAPEVFELGDDDRLTLLQEHVSPELESRVLDAVRLCPKQAISTEDD